MKNANSFLKAAFFPIVATLLIHPGAARADFVTATVYTGIGYTIAVNPVTNKIYMPNLSGFVTVIDGATNSTTTVPAGSEPYAVAVNPVTNKIYVANYAGSTVTVIDGATNSTATVVTGASPYAVAVNPVTNKIYVANRDSNTVTVIDGATNSTTTVAVGSEPEHLAVNPVTNKIYVPNYGSNTVTVIDGATNSTTTIAVGYPYAIALNPVTNKIYVAQISTSNITVIDGATNSTTTVSTGANPLSIAVNPVTNKIYVANGNEGMGINGTVTVIDGATNLTTTVTAGTLACAVTVNSVTNKIYVANEQGANVTIIDGATNLTTTLAATAGTATPEGVAVNPVTNKVYVALGYPGDVMVIDGSTNSTATVAVGITPTCAAVNPVTNKIYVSREGPNAYWDPGSITVLDGATDSTIATVPGGRVPCLPVVNPVTNKIYVANVYSNNITVIDGATNATTTLAAGGCPEAGAVNPVTNKIYVPNSQSNYVTVVDGATNATSTITIGAPPYRPCYIAVNPVTNKIYVEDEGTSRSVTVTVFDGATNTTDTVSTGEVVAAGIAVNPVTNKIYAIGNNSNIVTVIDGATKSTSSVAVGTEPNGIAVNQVTNKIYVSNNLSNNVTVIDGATNSTTTVAVGTNPGAIAVNILTNKIYVQSYVSNAITVIDGATNSTTTVAAGNGRYGVAVNPVTDKIYVPNINSNDITVITDAPINDSRVWAIPDSVPPLPSIFSKPTLSGKAVNRAFSNQCGIEGVFTRLNTVQSGWNRATITSMAGTDSTRWSWNWGTNDSLLPGENYLCVYAADSQCGTQNNLGLGTPFTGNVTVYPVYYIPLVSAPSEPILSSPSSNATNVFTNASLRWNTVASATSYRLQVSTTSSFALLLKDSTQSATSSGPLSLPGNARYYWLVVASNAAGAIAWAADSFTTGDISGPVHFITIPPTSTSWAILIKPAIAPTVNGRALRAGDEIGVFSAARGQCIGAGVWPDTGNLAILTFGKDTGLPDSNYGAIPGDTIKFRAWDASLSLEVGARVTYAGAGGPLYASPLPIAWTLASLTALPPPPVPALIAPANGAINIPTGPTLSWSSALTATSYHVQLSTNTAFVQCTSDSVLTVTAIVPVAGVQPDAKYYWRVNANNGCGVSAWSPIDSFNSVPLETAPVKIGWNFVCLNLHAEDSVTNDVFGRLHGFEMAKTLQSIYWPAYGINGVPVLHVTQGYQLYSDSLDTIHVCGAPVDPATTPVPMSAGWNFISYLPQMNIPIETALSGIASSLVLVKDENGMIYWADTSYNLNSIGSMQVGRGYQVYMRSPANLIYPSSAKSLIAGVHASVYLPRAKHFACVLNTGNNASILTKRVTLGGAVAPDSSEIGVYDSKGNLVGAGAVIRGAAAFPIWGKDELKKTAVAGCDTGEKLTFKLWNGKQEYPLEFHGKVQPQYARDELIFGSFVVPSANFISKFALSNAYPNPFRSNIRIFFDVPEVAGNQLQAVQINVYDLNGGMVRQLANGKYAAGHYGVSWDASGQAALSSNMYIVEMKASQFNQRLKLFRVK